MNNQKEKLLYHLNLINAQIGEALAVLDRISPYPKNREAHRTLINMSDKAQELTEKFINEKE